MNKKYEQDFLQGANIKVIGVGGGGVNAVEQMIDDDIKGIEFICANTDAQSLEASRAHKKIQIGLDITKGLGAGTNPAIGREAALEQRDNIKKALEGADMLFITTGMGGGTGTGASPVIAEIAKELGILTVAVVTKPFVFEGKKRIQVADDGIKHLTEHVDSLITIPNDKLLTIFGKDLSIKKAFQNADRVLCNSVKGISDIIKFPGVINLDFADVKTVMIEKGPAMMGTGMASGENRAKQATESAIRNPLLEEVQFKNAGGILVNISTCVDGLTLGEYGEVGEIVADYAKDNANIKIGMTVNPDLTNEMVITIIATGLTSSQNNNVIAPKKVDIIDEKKKEAIKKEIERPIERSINSYSGVGVSTTITQPIMASEIDDDYLDIPTFLRLQGRRS